MVLDSPGIFVCYGPWKREMLRLSFRLRSEARLCATISSSNASVGDTSVRVRA